MSNRTSDIRHGRRIWNSLGLWLLRCWATKNHPYSWFQLLTETLRLSWFWWSLGLQHDMMQADRPKYVRICLFIRLLYGTSALKAVVVALLTQYTLSKAWLQCHEQLYGNSAHAVPCKDSNIGPILHLLLEVRGQTPLPPLLTIGLFVAYMTDQPLQVAYRCSKHYE